MATKTTTETNGALKRVALDPAAIGEQFERKSIELNDPNLSCMGRLHLTLTGTTPVIINRFANKVAILDKQRGKAMGKKAPKDPDHDFLEALYIVGERPKTIEDLPKAKFGVPAIWFKCAAIRGAKMNDFAMTDAKTAFFVHTDWSDLVYLEHAELPVMRTDPVRNQGGVVDIRVRPMFSEWGVKLRLEYMARVVTAEQIVAWFVAAGFSNGVGEWRPFGRASTGVYGCFKVSAAEAWIPKMLTRSV